MGNKHKSDKLEKLMTLEEVAEYLRLSIHTIYKMAQKGKIPALKAGKKWRFRKEDIDQWLKLNKLSTKEK